MAVELNGVSYDGCRPSDGTLLDAKAQGYVWAMIDANTWKDFYTGIDKLMEQAQRQVMAAGDHKIEWYFAEKPVADFMEGALAKKLPQIKVIWQPPLRRGAP